MSQPQVQGLLGQPHQRRDEPPVEWKYGGVEVIFEEKDTTVSIIFLDDFDRVNKWIDLWILSNTLTIDQAETELQSGEISYHRQDISTLPGDTYLITSANVYLQFSSHEKDVSQLVAVFCSAYRETG